MCDFHKKVKLFLLLFLFPIIIPAQNNPQAQQLLNKTNKSQFFIENKGQWPKQVKFLARLDGMNAWITDSGVVYDYYKINHNYSPDSVMLLPPHEKDEFERTHTSCKGQVVRMDYACINLNAQKQGIDKNSGYYNYFMGNDSAKWTSFVGLYGEVLIKDAYKGIDIRYYFDNGLIRYDYLINAGADILQINFRLTGANDVVVNENGELIIQTILGEVKHGKFYAYQQYGNEKKEVSCSFARKEDGNFGVIASNYKKGLALVIDPLVWSTFIGGKDGEGANSIAFDSYKNPCITGSTYSINYPTTPGAYNTTYSYMNGDIFITKLNESATNLIFSTFIGSYGIDRGSSIKLDYSGNIYLTGCTSSNDFPTTNGAFDVIYNSVNFGFDVYALKLNSAGSGLIYSTYIGGYAFTDAGSIMIDDFGYAYISGSTSSVDFPTTNGAFSQFYNGNMDVFITKLNQTGTALVYSTFLGGKENDVSYGIVLDKDHNIYLAGYTFSTDFPTTKGVYDSTWNGAADAFIAKLNSNGSALLFSTYLGGNGNDYCHNIALDSNQNIFISGYTFSTDYPTTPTAYKQKLDSNLMGDVFISKLNSSASILAASTLLGGNDFDYGNSIALDNFGNSYVTGFTKSLDFPITLDALYQSINFTDDVFISKLSPDLSFLMYSTYFGGSKYDYCNFISVFSSKEVYITGSSSSSNFPTTIGVYNQNYNGIVDNDVFLSKISIFNQATNISFSKISCSQMDISWVKGVWVKRLVFMKEGNSGYLVPIDSNIYIANPIFGLGSQIDTSGWYCVYNDTGATVSVSGLKLNTTYRVMVLEYTGSVGSERYVAFPDYNNPVNQLSGSIPVATFTINIKQQKLTGNNFVFNSTATIPKNFVNFYWNFGDGNTSTIPNPVHSYAAVGSYKIVMIAQTGANCADTFNDSVFVLKDPPLFVSFSVNNACVGDTVLFKNTSTIIAPDSFLNFFWDFGDGNQTIVKDDPIHIYSSAGIYSITLAVLTKFGYKGSLIDSIEIYPSPTIDITALPDTIAIPGRPVTLAANGIYDQLLWFDSSTLQKVVVQTEGKYWVTATFNNGCKSTDMIELTKGENKEFVIVTVFTPNGDGINDKFIIKNIESIQPCKLKIYNRWGDDLFSSDNYMNNWNGTYKGKSLPEGTYYYVLETKGGKLYKGAVNILK